MPLSSGSQARRSYCCTEPGCNKSFLRSEHLSRHRLNHRPKRVFECPKCPKVFVRLDLYQKHELRHEKGMWYRRSGGVISRVQSSDVDSDSTTLQDEASETLLNIAHSNPIVTPQPQDASSHGQHHVQNGLQDVHGWDDTTTTGNRSTGEVGNTLFFDASANLEDLPEDLDWFFELPREELLPNETLDDSMHLVNSSHAFLPMEPMTSISPCFVPETRPPAQQPSPSDAWSAVRPKLLLALGSLAPDILDSEFFHPSNLEMCFEIFWEKYHNHFPFLHRPTLSITGSPPLLTTAIVTLGSTLATDETIYCLGQRIHDALRWVIFASGHFEPPAPLWCLQALLLVQAQGKMFSSLKNHEMAHIFHGAVLTMMERGRATYTNPVPIPEKCSWHQWAEDESSRRTSFFAFVMDAQHSSVFGHTPVLSVSDMRLPLPCMESLWECPSSEQWEEKLRLAPKPPHFLPTLRALLGKTLVPSTCSNFSRFILLHGLLNLTTHLLSRDCTTLGIEYGKVGSTNTTAPTTPVVEDWKEIMSRAINCWSFCLYSPEPSLCLEAAQGLHRMAYITLYTNIADIHLIAKDHSPHQLDISILQKKNLTKALSRLKAWSQKDEAKKAVLHALLLIKETMLTRRRYRAKEDIIAFRPWCIYYAMLVLWTYGVMVAECCSTPSSNDGETTLRAEDYVVQIMSSLQNGGHTATISPDISKTKGLMCAVRDALEGARWGLIQEAHVTLTRLIETVPRLAGNVLVCSAPPTENI